MDENEIALATGRRVYANRGIIGIDSRLAIFGGDSGHIYDPEYESEMDCQLTADELLEIAQIAISRWQRFQNKVRDNGRG
jgi:hypothetical protein